MPDLQPSDPRREPAIQINVSRSRRRTRTISWRIENRAEGVHVELRVPSSLTAAQEVDWRARVEKQVRDRLARQARKNDADLFERAARLRARYFDASLPLRAASWSDRQERRWGSCTPDVGSLRLSGRLRSMPDWVVDYVLVHELAHLAEANHSSRFWALVSRYPLTERARGFLAGFEHGSGITMDSEQE